MSAAHIPSIAVIVPNWNDTRHLPRCLRSVLDQESSPDELLVVDDASTDNSVEVIQALIRGKPRAQLLVNPVNIGTNRTINQSLARVRSDYVLPLSANDFVLPGIFARARASLARSPGAALWSAMTWLIDEEDRVIRLHPSPVVSLGDAYFTPEQCIRLAHRFGGWITGPTAMYHRETLQWVGGFDAAYGAPADLLTSLTVTSLRGAAYSPEPFAGFRIHAGSASSRALGQIAGLDIMLERLRWRGPQLSPQLFSAAFVERTALRYRFAAVRQSGGALIPAVAAKVTGWKRAALAITDRLVPGALGTLRVVLAFLILRPFDIWPTLVNRAAGWTFVRLRLHLLGGRPPR